MFNQRLQSLFAFLIRPSWWPELIRRIRMRLVEILLPNIFVKSAHVAIKWCEQNTIDPEILYKRLGVEAHLKMATIYPELYNYAVNKELEDEFNKNQNFKTGTGASADFLYNFCICKKPRTILETGVDRGWSSLAFLLALKESGGTLTSIDTPKFKSKKGFLRTGAVVHPSLRNNWNLLIKPDCVGIAALKKNTSQKFDLIHYDSDKSYWGRYESYIALFNLLNDGGSLISDDVADNIAFRDFCDFVDRSPIISLMSGIGQSKARYIGIVEK